MIFVLTFIIVSVTETHNLVWRSFFLNYFLGAKFLLVSEWAASSHSGSQRFVEHWASSSVAVYKSTSHNIQSSERHHYPPFCLTNVKLRNSTYAPEDTSDLHMTLMLIPEESTLKSCEELLDIHGCWARRLKLETLGEWTPYHKSKSTALLDRENNEQMRA